MGREGKGGTGETAKGRMGGPPNFTADDADESGWEGRG